jgi:hypothetical protein
MCLFVTVEAPETTRASLEATARSLPPAALRLSVEPVRRWPRARTIAVRGTITEAGGCACSLLADDANWDAALWSMRPEVLDPLARTLEAVGESAPEGFTAAALWVGDTPRQEPVVSLEQLVAIARAGQLGTRTRYRVPSLVRP